MSRTQYSTTCRSTAGHDDCTVVVAGQRPALEIRDFMSSAVTFVVSYTSDGDIGVHVAVHVDMQCICEVGAGEIHVRITASQWDRISASIYRAFTGQI